MGQTDDEEKKKVGAIVGFCCISLLVFSALVTTFLHFYESWKEKEKEKENAEQRNISKLSKIFSISCYEIQ